MLNDESARVMQTNYLLQCACHQTAALHRPLRCGMPPIVPPPVIQGAEPTCCTVYPDGCMLFLQVGVIRGADACERLRRGEMVREQSRGWHEGSGCFPQMLINSLTLTLNCVGHMYATTSLTYSETWNYRNNSSIII